MQRALIGLAAALSCAAVSAQGSNTSIADIGLAIEAGRLDQARGMIADQVKVRGSTSGLEKVLADLSFAAGKYDDALSGYETLLIASPYDRATCERAGIAALHLNRLADAERRLDCATADGSATWRAWNARGVLADLKQDWEEADRSYSAAARLAGDNALILNNAGYSRLLQGDWAGALGLFERAHALDPSIARLANNLELASAALAERLPSRRPNETSRAWAARLNDAGVAAQIMGDRRRAIASFTRALEASGSWYSRAANNLQVVGLR